jgi:hypothetical protein
MQHYSCLIIAASLQTYHCGVIPVNAASFLSYHCSIIAVHWRFQALAPSLLSHNIIVIHSGSQALATNLHYQKVQERVEIYWTMECCN